jgi:ribosomal-protein-alanine N-acetyltransferase
VVVAVTRLLTVNDAPVLSKLLRRNRAFLAPWQPSRPDGFYTLEGQQEGVAQALRQHEAGNSRPLVIVDDRAQVVGTITLQSIIRGAFQSCSVGYWLAETAQGQGLATQALREAVHLAFHDLHLHRVQAETLVHNLRSQRVLDRLDFARYGLAPAYLKIAGKWQDNLLYQLLTPAPELVSAE